MVNNRSKRKKHLELLRSSKVPVKKSKLSNTRHLILVITRVVLAGSAIALFIIFGIPYITDVANGVDPSLRYTPKVEATFNISEDQAAQSGASEFKSEEVALEGSSYNTKNDPFMDGDNIIFSTDTDKTNGLFLNTVVLYNVQDKTARELPNVEKKYDNILETRLSGNIAVWVDSMVEGGGRICGYDLDTEQMFVVKEYAYAVPELSVSGDYLAFMQVAGQDTQRLYLYNLKTRENVTVRLYDSKDTTCGNASVSGGDLVWSEYSTGNLAQVQRLLLNTSGAEYKNPDFGSSAYDPKTNGQDIVFSTNKISQQGDLMLSIEGDSPVKIAEGAVMYDIGDDYVVYMKDQKIYLYGIDNSMQTRALTSEATRGLLSSVNENNVCFYDTTDSAGTIEVVRYIDLGDVNG